MDFEWLGGLICHGRCERVSKRDHVSKNRGYTTWSENEHLLYVCVSTQYVLGENIYMYSSVLCGNTSVWEFVVGNGKKEYIRVLK
jgi:hypothetical protein